MITRSSTPPQFVKGNGKRNSETYEKLAAIKQDAEETGYDGWYDLGEWKAATANVLANAITTAGTDRQKKGGQRCPPGSWEAGVTELAEGMALVKVRYLGEPEAEGDDPAPAVALVGAMSNGLGAVAPGAP